MKDIISVREGVKSFRNCVAYLGKNGTPWGEGEKRSLYRMYDEGYDVTELAMYFQRTEMSIVQQLQNAGVFTAPGTERDRIPRTGCRCDSCQNSPFCKNKGFQCAGE